MTLRDYKQAYHAFNLDAAAALLSDGFSNNLNACIECCDRYANDAGRIALYTENQQGVSAQYTFAQLKEYSARFANFLKSRGVKPGDRVAALLPRTLELVIVILGTWRLGAVYQPLFTAFGGQAIAYRLATSKARMIVVDAVNCPKLDKVPQRPLTVFVADKTSTIPESDIPFWDELNKHAADFEPYPGGPEHPFLMMFTSGTTGPSKSLSIPLKALAGFVSYMRDGMDLRPEDKYWNIADPGWAYGLYYAVTGVLAYGHATLLYDGPFSPEATIKIIKKHKITNLAGSPTAFRMLIAAGSEVAQPIRGQLRVVSSCGEPLNPEVIRWFAENLAVVIHDHYGQTELGMVVGNHHGLKHPVQVGTTGFPMLGYRVVVLDEASKELPPHQPGIMAIDRAHSPLFWFTGYENVETPTLEKRYYRTGDTVELNDDGSISFVGRLDDVITSAGYRIGPFDVESALIEHPAVIEAGVIGKPDPERTQIVKAYVVLQRGYDPTEQLRAELQMHVRNRLSAHIYPREIEFIAQLPKTPSGKIQRFVLRSLEAAKTAQAV